MEVYRFFFGMHTGSVDLIWLFIFSNTKHKNIPSRPWNRPDIVYRYYYTIRYYHSVRAFRYTIYLQYPSNYNWTSIIIIILQFYCCYCYCTHRRRKTVIAFNRCSNHYGQYAPTYTNLINFQRPTIVTKIS